MSSRGWSQRLDPVSSCSIQSLCVRLIRCLIASKCNASSRRCGTTRSDRWLARAFVDSIGNQFAVQDTSNAPQHSNHALNSSLQQSIGQKMSNNRHEVMIRLSFDARCCSFECSSHLLVVSCTSCCVQQNKCCSLLLLSKIRRASMSQSRHSETQQPRIKHRQGIKITANAMHNSTPQQQANSTSAIHFDGPIADSFAN